MQNHKVIKTLSFLYLFESVLLLGMNSDSSNTKNKFENKYYTLK